MARFLMGVEFKGSCGRALSRWDPHSSLLDLYFAICYILL